MADLLIHVLDCSNPRIHELDQAVYDVLKELNAENKPVINVLNKVDLADNAHYLERLNKEFRDAILVSALKGISVCPGNTAVHLQPLYKEKICSRRACSDNLPNTKKAASRSLALPIFPEMKKRSRTTL